MDTKEKIKFIAVIVFVYFILTEFILPPVKYLPSFSIMYDSFLNLQNQFDLLMVLGEFLSIFYITFVIIILLFYFLRSFVVKSFLFFSNLNELITPFYFLPFLFFIFYISFLIESNFIAELIFILFSVSAMLKYHIALNIKNIDGDYILAAKGLGKDDKSIYSQIIPRLILPKLKNKILLIHLIIINLVIIFEYINDYSLGGILNDLFKYNDVAGCCTIFLFLWIIFGAMHIILQNVLNSVINWEV